MAVYLVAFTLNRVGADPAIVIEDIKKLSRAWMHYIPGVILVDTNDSADELAKKIYKFITKSDYLLVIRVTAEHQGWLPKDAWDWLNERIY